jgi:WXXGXW repeat (2 copies)
MRFAKSVRMLAATVATLALACSLPASTSGQVAVGISVGFPPPELPVYAQPICPGEGFIWTPGYWAWDPDYEDYYWVPGTWVLAPAVGLLWTPGYWAWGGSSFVFYDGYWAPQVGFYGGVNYGYGYFGRGYEGGRWDGGRFYYNRTVNNINVTEVHNVYNTTVVNNNVTRVSYNGGNGGVTSRPTAQEEAVAHERHRGPVATQTQHVQEARSNRELRASENHGKPPIASTQKPGVFSGSGVVAAREGGRYNPPPNRGANNANRPVSTGRPESNANRPNYVHPNDLPKVNRPDRPPTTGNPKTDQKYQREQEKLYQKQEQERQTLQQKQDQEHQRMMQQRADDARRQQTEQRHQQQTQQMQQSHEQQQQRMEQRQQPRQQAPPPRPNEKRPPNERPN